MMFRTIERPWRRPPHEEVLAIGLPTSDPPPSDPDDGEGGDDSADDFEPVDPGLSEWWRTAP